jgi:hypothetical protein
VSLNKEVGMINMQCSEILVHIVTAGTSILLEKKINQAFHGSFSKVIDIQYSHQVATVEGKLRNAFTAMVVTQRE